MLHLPTANDQRECHILWLCWTVDSVCVCVCVLFCCLVFVFSGQRIVRCRESDSVEGSYAHNTFSSFQMSGQGMPKGQN
jgi:hypothetical protein